MNDAGPIERRWTDRTETVSALHGSTAVVVLGMHRSGTSAVAGMLHHLGINLGSRLMPASPDNPRGYWEHVDIVAVHHRLMASFGYAWDDIRTLPPGFADSAAAAQARRQLAAILTRDFPGHAFWGIKDPRLCRLLPLWHPLLEQLGVTPAFVIVLRHPAAVAASLAARDGLGAERALLLWLRHVLEAERETRGRPRCAICYEDLVGVPGWQAAAAQIAAATGISWPIGEAAAEAAVDAYLSPELRHARGDAAANPLIGGWLEDAYGALAGSEDPSEVCDRVSRELERASRLFLPIIGDMAQRPAAPAPFEAKSGERLVRLEHQAAELRALVLRQDAELKSPRQGAAAPPGLGPMRVEDAYPRWIESRASTAVAHRQWVEERVAEWPFVPKLALGMILPIDTEARAALTLRSLHGQIAGDWELHVAAERAIPEFLAGETCLFWHQGEDSPAAALNRQLAASMADHVALIDGGDQLAPHALFSLADGFFRHPEWGAAYSDEDRIDPQGVRSGPHFKPGFNLELLRGLPYVGGLLAVRRDVFAAIGGFDPQRDGTEEYDLALRLAERLGGAGFGHIADVLYHRFTLSGRSQRPVAEICAEMPAVVQAHLDRLGIRATAETGAQPHFCRVRYRHDGPEPLVSIIVPSRDRLPLLRRCVESVLQLTRYENYELIVIDNGSTDPDACQYLQAIEDKFAEIGSRIRILRHPAPFNFAAMNNRTVREAARGDYICLLNNDAAPLDGDWLGEMMALARQPDVGAVGAKLLYPDGRIQHAGVVLGIGWGAPAEHPYIGEPENAFGYWGRLQVPQEFSAVTAACLVTRRSLYEQLGGLDEEAFAVSYNDVDYCLRVGAAGHRVLWTPYARLLHEASASLRSDVERAPEAEKSARFHSERITMFRRWLPRIARDPAYNRNLSSCGAGFTVETEGAPTWDPDFRPRPRVLAYPADREGCGEYRIIAPSRAAFAAGRLHAYQTMRLASPPELARVAPDAIVLQRQLEAHQIDYIEQLRGLSGAFRVFELDDLITNLPPKSVHRKAIARDIGDRLKRALSLCHRLVVSTEPLAQAYGRLCDEVKVLPNRLERARWAGLTSSRRFDGKPRVGWAGAVGHTGDLAVIASVVEATAKEIDWVFFGMCPENLRRLVAEAHAWVPLYDYPEKLASLNLDLAVAPLEQHPFNEAKSNLRLLEYGILGYPVVCTDIVPYQCGLPVVRVPNKANAWIRTIREMLADREALRATGERLRASVLAEWMLDDHLDAVAAAWLP